ncbi:MAG: hypothetical protein K0Q72_4602 [Armatimonadetes bacterium]|jgi:uncharacterized membrane protein (UPF0127 family)|nr:hypothetical protein [Armatimonadota bacterium]
MKSRQNRPSLRNATRDGVIATEVFEAGSLWERAAGLLAHPPLQAGQAMWLEPCGSIHTWGMRYPIDVLYLDRSHRVLDVVQHLRPWRIAIAPRGTRVTVELPAGAAGKVRRGDQLTLEREGN